MKKIASPSRHIMWSFIAGLLIACITAMYYHSNAAYPYYISWDMDLSTVIDTLLIHSHMMPTNFSHTSFGIYLLMSWLQTIGHVTNQLSVTHLWGLAHAVSPLLPVTELTNYSRHITPFIASGLVLFLWLAVIKGLRLQRWDVRVLVLLLLAAMPGIRTQLPLIRSELYALLYWAIALYFGACALTAAPTNKRALFLLSGLFLGIAFTTKQQTIFVLTTYPFLLACFASRQTDAWACFTRPCKNALPIAIANNLLFWILRFCSLPASTHLIVTFRHHYGPQPIWLAAALLCIGTLALAIHATITKRHAVVHTMAHLCGYLLLGFFISFFFTVLLYPLDFHLAWHHTLLMFKLLLMGKLISPLTQHHDIHTWNGLLITLKANLVCCSLIALTLMAGLTQALRQRMPRGHCLLLCFLLADACLVLFLGVRPHHALDSIWVHVVLTLTLLATATVWLETINHTFRTTCGYWLLFGSLILNAAFTFTECGSSYYTARNYFAGVYGRNQNYYTAIMLNTYFKQPSLARSTIAQSTHIDTIKFNLWTLYPTTPINLKQVSALTVGMRLTNDPTNHSTRVVQVPSQLNGLTAVIPKKDFNTRLFLVSHKRKDLSVLFFVPTKPGSPIDKAAYPVKVSDEKTHAVKTYVGYSRDHFPLSLINQYAGSKDYFMVIQPTQA